MPSFDFGENWREFSHQRLDDTRLRAAMASLEQLLPAGTLRGRSFLDVGCGSGLFALAASVLGAGPVVGIDVSPACVAISKENRQRLAPESALDFRVVSALDSNALAQLGSFELVYAWGSLHHTGDMWSAIDMVAQRVANGGFLILAIYAKHFTSPAWGLIKRTYNASPRFVRPLMVWTLGPVIFVAKFAVTRRSPLKKERGMDFWFDVIDWVGGYPYEFATPAEVQLRLEGQGFVLRRLTLATVPTGCNEFLFERERTPAPSTTFQGRLPR